MVSRLDKSGAGCSEEDDEIWGRRRPLLQEDRYTQCLLQFQLKFDVPIMAFAVIDCHHDRVCLVCTA